MESRNDILTELQNISPVIAGMAKTNVFTVPQGYFETLNHTIVASINDGLNIDEKNNADIPTGYFDNLAASILDKIKAEEETESDLLKSLRYKNTFEAPQGYFDNLTGLILTKVNTAVAKDTEEFSEVLNTIGKKNIFEVPQGYFENLAASVLTKINTVSSTEADEFSEALNGISNKNIFDVPQGYFDNLPVAIVSKIQPKAATVVNMRSWTSVLKYAAAAMLTGTLALGVYKYTNTITPDKIAPVAVAKLDPVIEKGKAMNDEKFEEALNNLSETDIAKYLEKTSTESDVSVLMAGVEENNLPNQEDYLTDEKTLENFLKDIDTQKLNN